VCVDCDSPSYDTVQSGRSVAEAADGQHLSFTSRNPRSSPGILFLSLSVSQKYEEWRAVVNRLMNARAGELLTS
jgi:hypothetical protein